MRYFGFGETVFEVVVNRRNGEHSSTKQKYPCEYFFYRKMVNTVKEQKEN